MTELSSILRELSAPSAGRGVLATLVTVAGSSYRRPGARLLLCADGRHVGSISGGCLEEDVLLRAHRVAATGRPELVTYDTTSENDLVWGVGLGCHGIVQVLIEAVAPQAPWIAALAANQASHRATDLAVVWRTEASVPLGTRLASELSPDAAGSAGVFFNHLLPPTRLVIFGAGDDAQPLAALADQLGWHITVADPRVALVSAQRFPQAAALVAAPAADLVAQTALPAGALAVVMTHHYVHDVPILRRLLPLELPYVGLLGPRQRAERILVDLERDGLHLTPQQRARLHAPIGLDLGAETPAEVALAILAEMQACLGQRDARPLRERAHPIHR